MIRCRGDEREREKENQREKRKISEMGTRGMFEFELNRRECKK